MGSKKLNKLLTLALSFVMISSIVFAQDVRVGIMSNDFSKVQYDNLNIFCTNQCNIYTKSNQNDILTVDKDIPISITTSENDITLCANGKNIKFDDIVIITSPDGTLGINDLKRKGKQALYRGSFEIIRTKNNPKQFYLVNVLDVQDYLKGVVPNEMPVSFGLEALKAQAVAARNYVLTPRTRAYKEFDVVDSVASQVYFGYNTEISLANQAIDETAGLVALYNWNLILAQYCSTAGGYTESFENTFSDAITKSFPSTSKPYLKAKADMLTQSVLKTEQDVKDFYTKKPDSYDIKSPYYRWERTWSYDELSNVLSNTLISQSKTGFVHPKLLSPKDFGELKSIKVLRRGDSGKIIELEIITSKNIFKVQKELVIRRAFTKDGKALPSANVYFETSEIEKEDGAFSFQPTRKEKQITAYGGGFGHGVGMSQYGAGFMATNLKMNFSQILKHYYSNIDIGTIPEILSAHETQNKISQTFYCKDKKANLVVNNKFKVSKIILQVNNRNAEEVYLDTTSKAPIKIDISNYLKRGLNTVNIYYPQDESNRKAVRLYIEPVIENERKYNF